MHAELPAAATCPLGQGVHAVAPAEALNSEEPQSAHPSEVKDEPGGQTVSLLALTTGHTPHALRVEESGGA